MQRIVITGNCQVSGLAAALKLLCPRITVDAVAIGWPEEMWATEGRDLVAASDLWVRMITPRDHLLAPEGFATRRFLRIPSITFPAFHPDLVFASTPSAQFVGVTPYHSAIGLWAWKRGLPPDSLTQLFSAGVLEQLGYLDYWSISEAEMASSFAASDLAFKPFWTRIHRLGVFMHTVNHPRIAALVVLAKLIASTIGQPPAIWDDPVDDYLDDGLNTAIWPVHPRIAQRYGLLGSNRWKLLSQQLNTPAEFGASAWAAYEGTDPSQVYCPRLDDLRYERVLSLALAK